MKPCLQRGSPMHRRSRNGMFIGVPLSLVVVLGRVSTALAQTETPAWLVRATALQRYLGYDVPLDKLTLTATHNSFTSDKDNLTHSNFEVVTAQIYGITDQLSCLGVRGLELDPHYIAELATDGDEASAIRLCHASADAASQVVALCESFGWDLCESVDVVDYGNDTGCRTDSPTLREGFEEIAAWLFLEENAEEVVFIKLDSQLDDQDELVSTIAADVFGEATIFSPANWEEYSGSEGWPSPEELVQFGTRIILAGLEPSTLVFGTESDVTEEIIAAVDFRVASCDESDGYPEPSWIRVQGDMVQYRLSRFNTTIFEYVPDTEEYLNENQTRNVMQCGYTPTFDRLDTELMKSTVWSWDTDRPETGFALPRAAVLSVDGARWTDVGTDAEEGELHGVACRDPDLDSRYSWDVIPIYNSSAYNSSAVDSEVSVDDDNTDDDEDDDGDDDGDGDDASEYQYNGTFIGASDACNSIGSGWVFGAPRTAYENLAVREAMKNAGIDTVWVNYISQGDEQGDSLCWSREGGREYCVPANDTCSEASSEEDTPVAGEIPLIILAGWEVDNYTRPNYTVTAMVDNLHGWVRVAGDNEFDLEDKGYVTGIILAAVPVFVFGLVVACCCLPVGHIAAGSKEHHVDGRGFFGSLCPRRCKQGDFIGSGTLAVVVVFTLLTVFGGTMAIYGVRSVDADVVHLWESLDGMGQKMLTAQTAVNDLYELLVGVEDTFPTVASCSGLASLKAASTGIKSASKELEGLVDGNIGSVGRSIQSVNTEIRNTAGVRRGVVYSAGGLVLVLSIVYVVVGYYALGKDDGNGKGGGARMRGPVVVGCSFLPLTLLVILACWLLFGLSTSVSLLTSDFCMAPTENTKSVFRDEGDKEVVSFYTTCAGSNAFLSALSTAHLQATGASQLLASVDADTFAAACSNETSTRVSLEADMVAILEEIDAIGYLIQCSNVNPYFVDGVEGSLCHDAPSRVWFVICGFGVVSVSLFVVAVAFRLLLQQKEEGLYSVVYEDDMSEASSSLSSCGEREKGLYADGSDEVGNSLESSSRHLSQGRGQHPRHHSGPIVAASKSPSSSKVADTNRAVVRVEPTGNGRNPNAVFSTSPTASGTGSSSLSPPVANPAPAAHAVEAMSEHGSKASRHTPIEYARPLPRPGLIRSASRGQQPNANFYAPSSSCTAGDLRSMSAVLTSRTTGNSPRQGGDGGRGPTGTGLGQRVSSRWSATSSRRPGLARSVSISRSQWGSSTNCSGHLSGSDSDSSDGRDDAAWKARAESMLAEPAPAAAPGDEGRGEDTVRNPFDSHRRRSGRAASLVGGANHGGDASGHKKHKTTRLFRALAGLDDPDVDVAPSVIVSRHFAHRGTRNLGGEGQNTITFTVARPVSMGRSRASVDSSEDRNRRHSFHSSVGGGPSRRNVVHEAEAGDSDVDDNERVWPEEGMGVRSATATDEGKASGRHSGRLDGSGFVSHGGRTSGSGRTSHGGRIRAPTHLFSSQPRGRIRAPNHLFSSQQGTWAAFNRECRDSKVSVAPSAPVFRSRRSSGGDGHDGSGRIHGDLCRASQPNAAVHGTVSGYKTRDGGAGVTGFSDDILSSQSSTVSGLTGWRRQRMQVRTVARNANQQKPFKVHAVEVDDDPNRDRILEVSYSGRCSQRAELSRELDDSAAAAATTPACREEDDGSVRDSLHQHIGDEGVQEQPQQQGKPSAGRERPSGREKSACREWRSAGRQQGEQRSVLSRESSKSSPVKPHIAGVQGSPATSAGRREIRHPAAEATVSAPLAPTATRISERNGVIGGGGGAEGPWRGGMLGGHALSTRSRSAAISPRSSANRATNPSAFGETSSSATSNATTASRRGRGLPSSGAGGGGSSAGDRRSRHGSAAGTNDSASVNAGAGAGRAGSFRGAPPSPLTVAPSRQTSAGNSAGGGRGNESGSSRPRMTVGDALRERRRRSGSGAVGEGETATEGTGSRRSTPRAIRRTYLPQIDPPAGEF